MKRNLQKSIFSFLWENNGSILAEALIVIPVITIFAVGVVEFGNVFWQRHQLEVGVRDTARYWSRCTPSINGIPNNCSTAKARNLAFYGNPSGTGALRVPGWDEDSELTIDIASNIVSASGTVDYNSSPLFGFLGISPITLQYTHQERYIGW